MRYVNEKTNYICLIILKQKMSAPNGPNWQFSSFQSVHFLCYCPLRFPPVVPNVPHMAFLVFSCLWQPRWQRRRPLCREEGARQEGRKTGWEAAERIGTNHRHAGGHLTGNYSTFLRPRGLLRGTGGDVAALLWQTGKGYGSNVTRREKKLLQNLLFYFCSQAFRSNNFPSSFQLIWRWAVWLLCGVFFFFTVWLKIP